MARLKKPPKYKGILAKPREYHVPSPFTPPEDREHLTKEAQEKNLSDFVERIAALFKHYNRDMSKDGDWIQLLFDLAENHVPGFQVFVKPPKRGQPKSWNIFSETRLYLDIETRKKDGKKVPEICHHLTKKGGLYEGFPKGTLERRYRAIAKKGKALSLYIPESLPEAVKTAAIDEMIKCFPVAETPVKKKAKK